MQPHIFKSENMNINFKISKSDFWQKTGKFFIISIILINSSPIRSEQITWNLNYKGCNGIKIGETKASIEKRLGRPPEVATGDTIAAGELTQGSRFRRFPTWLYRSKGVIINFGDQTNRVISVECKNNIQ